MRDHARLFSYGIIFCAEKMAKCTIFYRKVCDEINKTQVAKKNITCYSLNNITRYVFLKKGEQTYKKGEGI